VAAALYGKTNAAHPVQITSTSDVWQRWLAECSETFFLYARQQTRCLADAEDVLQEALFESWRRAGGQPPEKPLVFATIRRRAMDLARSTQRRSVREDAALGESSEAFVMPEFGANDTHAQLAEAVEKLPEHLRETLTLRVWGELSFPEIGRITGVSENTAASRHRYALEQLREHLGNVLK
jgi:RNA polymerase sigma-70 factor (ECF subfamily)